ncbi:hypothetical protein B0H14DRAFT_530029 [Mycena olivaceomarginata]|nr:hypothetical protein B0H14DRAFT_530029 [Mycena olivaceomarginata]
MRAVTSIFLRQLHCSSLPNFRGPSDCSVLMSRSSFFPSPDSTRRAVPQLRQCAPTLPSLQQPRSPPRVVTMHVGVRCEIVCGRESGTRARAVLPRRRAVVGVRGEAGRALGLICGRARAVHISGLTPIQSDPASRAHGPRERRCSSLSSFECRSLGYSCGSERPPTRRVYAHNHLIASAAARLRVRVGPDRTRQLGAAGTERCGRVATDRTDVSAAMGMRVVVMMASNSSASVCVSPCLPPPIATGARGRRVPLSTWTRSHTERGGMGVRRTVGCRERQRCGYTGACGSKSGWTCDSYEPGSSGWARRTSCAHAHNPMWPAGYLCAYPSTLRDQHPRRPFPLVPTTFHPCVAHYTLELNAYGRFVLPSWLWILALHSTHPFPPHRHSDVQLSLAQVLIADLWL